MDVPATQEDLPTGYSVNPTAGKLFGEQVPHLVVVTRVEVGYFIATAVLCTLLWGIYRQPPRVRAAPIGPATSG